jgi:hypothetical protein
MTKNKSITFWVYCYAFQKRASCRKPFFEMRRAARQFPLSKYNENKDVPKEIAREASGSFVATAAPLQGWQLLRRFLRCRRFKGKR